jgi:hypothetical protein
VLSVDPRAEANDAGFPVFPVFLFFLVFIIAADVSLKFLPMVVVIISLRLSPQGPPRRP